MRALIQAFVAVASVATIAGAQVDSVRRDSASRPFVRGGTFDKPYLAGLMGRTAIGG